jgi:tetratricopeptide (TPR) repeat protein
MRDLDRADITSLAAEGREDLRLSEPVSIRVSPHSYFTALLLGTFFSALFFYLELDLAGMLLFGIAWIVVPFLALNDRISFDGRRLERTGLVPRIWSRINGSRRRLRLSDIEQVETHAVRAVKRGGNIMYRYRTVLHGKGLSVTIASGGEDHRRMIKGIMPRLSENLLDNRSIELRDHLADPKETLMRAEFARIPSADVLAGSLRSEMQKRHVRRYSFVHEGEEERADDLRSLANELRLGGFLLQALEAFRRALLLKPHDPRLLFEFARCLYSFAGTERDPRLERRAYAALRLAERRAAEDADLLIRLGEWYSQLGDWRRATTVFQRALDRAGESFRTALGFAELALREGKIAHVIHHFSTAGRIAETTSLRRWSRAEAAYFSHLNSDDEYMELEISRVNMLETVERSKRTSLHIAFVGFPAILYGILLDDPLIANIGWAVSAIALLIWTGLIFSTNLLSDRIPHEMVEPED